MKYPKNLLQLMVMEARRLSKIMDKNDTTNEHVGIKQQRLHTMEKTY